MPVNTPPQTNDGRETRELKRTRRARRQRAEPQTARIEGGRPTLSLWVVAGAVIAALFAAFLVYDPALNGAFLFDDFGLPFYTLSMAQQPVTTWVSGVRPLLMLSYWCNFQLAGNDVQSYHVWNVFLHAVNSVLVFLFVRRVLAGNLFANTRALVLAACAAAVFLLHPLQTEPVAYISGRSEVISALFVLAAMVVFAHQAANQVISWRTTCGIAFLYACAAACKEQAVVLPAAFLLTDVALNGLGVREAVKRRSRLYAVLSGVGLVGLIGTWRVLEGALSAGFHVPGITWYEYLFTQFRVLFLYLRLFVFPAWQNGDYDLAISHTLLQHGSLFALIAAVAAFWAAWRIRDRRPLLIFGLGLFALFLAPTSSVVPIQDLAAERRMYLPILGLLLIGADLVRTIEMKRLVPTAVVVGIVLGAVAHERSKVWASRITFWEDVTHKSPGKARGYTHLITAYVQSRRCADAIRMAENIPAAYRDNAGFLTDWSKALECVHRNDEAIEKLKRAAAISPTAGQFLMLGWAYERLGATHEAESAINTAMHSEIRGPFDRDAIKLYEEQSRGRIRSLY